MKYEIVLPSLSDVHDGNKRVSFEMWGFELFFVLVLDLGCLDYFHPFPQSYRPFLPFFLFLLGMGISFVSSTIQFAQTLKPAKN
jgi:hypothetical protein